MPKKNNHPLDPWKSRTHKSDGQPFFVSSTVTVSQPALRNLNIFTVAGRCRLTNDNSVFAKGKTPLTQKACWSETVVSHVGIANLNKSDEKAWRFLSGPRLIPLYSQGGFYHHHTSAWLLEISSLTHRNTARLQNSFGRMRKKEFWTSKFSSWCFAGWVPAWHDLSKESESERVQCVWKQIFSLYQGISECLENQRKSTSTQHALLATDSPVKTREFLNVSRLR